MNANELADNQLTHVIGENNNGEEVVITLRKPLYLESFVRQQQDEIEALKSGKIRAYDNGVEDGRKPNTNPVKELTREDRLKLIGTLKWAEDLLREAGHDEAVDEVQDCIMLLRKAQEK